MTKKELRWYLKYLYSTEKGVGEKPDPEKQDS